MVVDAAPRVRPHAVPALLGAAVLAQVLFPLAAGSNRDSLTVLIVALVAAASLVHAALSRGSRVLFALAAVTVVGGFAVEVLGVHTGFPFGDYRYGDSLGAKLFGVPVVIAFAWPMLAWPAALAARRLGGRFPVRVVIGAWALAVWDLFLDPQLVAAGGWHWLDRTPHLPGVPSVPLSDYVGWLGVSLLISLVLQLVLRGRADADDRYPLAFYVWTWAASTLALAAFLGLPWAALWGGLAMGMVAVPVARSLAAAR